MIYFFAFIFVLLLVIIVLLSIQFFNIVFRGFAPFISTKFRVILTIIKELDLTGDEVVYELGAGQAGFLRAVEEKFKNDKLVGVEYSWWPYFLARLQLSLSNSRIKIIRKDFFKINLREADIIYCFLNPKTMNKLGSKIKKECRSGTLLISYCFKVKDLELEKTIKEGDNNIYFYRV